MSDSYPKCVSDFLENLAEVNLLIDIHAEIAGPGPGRKYDVEVLNKSAVVLVVACWEAFVEDLATAALTHLVHCGKDHTVFPQKVLDKIGSKHSGPAAWKLAGNGWKKVLKDNLVEMVAKTIGKLNTPRSSQVDELFAGSIGFDNISEYWKWQGRTADKSRQDLDHLVNLRCSVAHRVRHAGSVRKKDVQRAVDLVSRLAARSTNVVAEYLLSRTGTRPWGDVIVYGDHS